MEAGYGSSAGRVRETNEDTIWCGERLAVVADGMGGAAGGEVASRLAVETLKGWRLPPPHMPARAIEEELLRAVHAANQEIYDRALAEPSLRGMGTTLTVAVLSDLAVIVAHVGDSRAYRVVGGRLQQITADHSVVGELMRSGGLSPAEARRHPYRNMLTRALGTARHVEVDVHRVAVKAGEGILLCTDGLTNTLSDSEIEAVIAGERDAQACVDALIAAANARGAPDNVSAILLYPGGSQRD